MSEDAPPKSAYELAMERLHAKDRAAGIRATKPLTVRQKRAIAALREEARAKLAELEILYNRDRRDSAGDAEKLEELERRYRTDRERVNSRLETDVAQIKSGTVD